MLCSRKRLANFPRFSSKLGTRNPWLGHTFQSRVGGAGADLGMQRVGTRESAYAMRKSLARTSLKVSHFDRRMILDVPTPSSPGRPNAMPTARECSGGRHCLSEPRLANKEERRREKTSGLLHGGEGRYASPMAAIEKCNSTQGIAFPPYSVAPPVRMHRSRDAGSGQ